ncbi:MAG: polysaccharide biosynthesis C-terminal domain-containing protein [Lachnospiraceae bacterium]|nr:polysaccharide biosynthesis C-terminal domain-containing protein [Lachnospiraceae bacterium]
MLLLVHVIDLLGSVIGIDWLYHGFEDFAITTKRNFVVKMIGIVCVFLFVKDKNDAVIYVLIQSVSSIAGAVVMWFGIKRYIDRAYVSLKNFRRHYSGILSLFLVQISGSVYMYLDKIMIGTMTDIVAENGYYEQAQKIINLSTTIITSLSTVLQPRISNAFISSDTKGISHYMEKSLHFVLFLGTPMTLGLIACSSNLVPWFLGKDFLKSQELLYICAPIIIIHSIYNVFGYQYLLGTKQDRVMTLTILGGSGCNVVLNALFIPRMLSVGASIASVAAEFVVMLLQILYVRKQIAIPSIKGYALKCLAAGVVMFVVVVGIGWKLSSGFLQTMGLISVGAGVYFWMMFFFKNDFVMEMVDRIKTGTRNVFGKN